MMWYLEGGAVQQAREEGAGGVGGRVSALAVDGHVAAREQEGSERQRHVL